jgi:D-sedoheptulose 7-phosphate isomerase
MTIRHVILDRDGVLNELAPADGYITKVAEWRWIPGALDGLAALWGAGIRTSIATNQSAVGRGFMSDSQLAAIHTQMLADVARHGAAIDRVLVCPHQPSERCACRKPGPGLLAQALVQADIPLHETLMIGDDETDVEASWSVGMGAVLVRTGRGRATEARLRSLAVPVFDDLAAAARAIIADEVPIAPEPRLLIQRSFLQHARVLQSAAVSAPQALLEASEVVYQCLATGHKILACGNGGSAADAQHLVGEFVGRYVDDRPARAALALTCDGATMTALANDYGYERVFARQVEALACPGDVLVAISTSGTSRNVIAAAIAARARACPVIGLTGETGGDLGAHCTIVLAAPSSVTARIQELHGLYIHALVEAFERRRPLLP